MVSAMELLDDGLWLLQGVKSCSWWRWGKKRDSHYCRFCLLQAICNRIVSKPMYNRGSEGEQPGRMRMNVSIKHTLCFFLHMFSRPWHLGT